jgi:hypothetical protein
MSRVSIETSEPWSLGILVSSVHFILYTMMIPSDTAVLNCIITIRFHVTRFSGDHLHGARGCAKKSYRVFRVVLVHRSTITLPNLRKSK